MRCAVRLPLHRNVRDGDNLTFGEPLFQIIIFRFALSESKPPTVIVNRDVDVVRIIKGLCATLEGRIVEIPFRRSLFPDELREIVMRM